MSTTQWLGGSWYQGEGAEWASHDPMSGECLWRGRAASEGQVDRALRAARAAARDWGLRPTAERARLVQTFASCLRNEREALAEVICRETGKPFWEGRAEVEAMIAKVGLALAAEAERRPPTSSQTAAGRAATRYRAHGVVVVLGPYNMPGHLPNGHIVPALVAGNTVVWKPSEQCPLVGQRVAELWQEAGLPAGVLNLVQGGRETGACLVAHPEVDGVFFTGSFAGGCAISRALAERPGTLLALEMGGNNPLLVQEVQDLDAAAYWTVQSAYVTAGQRCTCARRLVLVQGRESKALLERLVTMLEGLRIGAWNDAPQPFMGPVISASVAGQLLATEERLVQAGALPLTRMKARQASPALLTPGLLDVSHLSDRGDEEYFGPLLQVVQVPDFESALVEANRTRYGLAAGLFSDNPRLWEAFYPAVRAGVVNWNRPLTGASSALPFGGVGQSGNHRPSGYFAADYCSFPVATLESDVLPLPEQPTPGIPTLGGAPR